MADPKTRLVLGDFSGGRNGAVSPLGPEFGANQVVDAVNGDWYRTNGLRKRWGSSNLSMTNSSMIGNVGWLGRHVPGTVDADAELWAADDSGGVGAFTRLDNSVTWAAPVGDPPANATISDITSASLDGRFFLAYDAIGLSTRLHVYDPSSGTIRATGIDPGTNAPTVANTGSGAYPAIKRYYRTRFVNGIVSYSEPTPSVSFTPSGAGLAARVTRPTAPGEGETTWLLEVSLDNVTFYVIASTVIATTFVDDAILAATYTAGTFLVSFLTGTFQLQKSYRLIAADQNRLIGWGSWVSTDKQNRMEFSAVVGSLDHGDAERVDATTNYYMDFDENDSGPPTALCGPVWDKFYAFKSRQMYELAPTGSPEQPYRRIKITGTLGCVGPHAACQGEDANGNPCIYFMAHRGVFRYGLNGMQYLSRGIEDLLLGPTAVLNMTATKVIAHLVYYPDIRQLWVWHATGASASPDTLSMLDVMANGGQGGWSRYTGSLAHARCSVMFANSIGATMGFPMVPYVGSTDTVNRIIKAADSTVSQDSGVSYQTTVTTRPLEVPGYNLEVQDALVLAPAAPAVAPVSISAVVTPDFGASPTVTGVADLTAAGSETRVTRPFRGSALAGAQFMQLTIGDAAAINNTWSFDRVVVPVQKQEPVV